MVGLFINTVPARARLTGQDVVTWLRDLQAAQVESRRHDFVSLAQIQQWTGLEPLDSVLVFENYPLDRATTTPRVVGISAVDNTTFPLTLSAHLDSSLHLDLAYDPRLFDSLTVERLAARLRVILDGIATSPSVRVDQLPWTLPGETDVVRGALTDVPAVTYPAIFEAQVARTPDRTALVFQDTRLTFLELNARANQLAH
ncbi:condensation domain-containing protein, partial [Kibdelosporangium lantanae]